MGHKLPGTQ
ncbi:unnamed protein product, partial [Rotaria sordida]